MRYFKILFTLMFILVSCTPVVADLPTEEPVPPTPTTLPPTATPAPQQITDAEELPNWVEEFVHAYGGTVLFNGSEVDTSGLVMMIKTSPDAFLTTKRIDGTEYRFLVVNGIPLAMQEGRANWQEASMAKLGEMNGVEFESSLRLDGRKYNEFRRISEKALGKSPVVVMTTNLDLATTFGDFTEDDWTRVLNQWDAIQQDFSSGKTPPGFPYNWRRGWEGMDADVVRAFGGAPQFRVQSLYEGGVGPDEQRSETLKQFKKGKSHEDMLKIFEFVVRTRVLQFPEVTRWDVSDEVAAAYVMFKDNNVPELNFWGKATGLSPADLTLLVAGWVKQDHPEAQTLINEPNIFETGNPVASAEIEYFYNDYLPEIVKGNQAGIIDGVVAQNNWWIYEPQDWTLIGSRIDTLSSMGLTVGGSETMIVSGDTPTNFCCGRSKLVEVDNPDLAQAEMFAQWLNLYLDKGIKTIGFGNIDDFYAWTQDVDLPDANPTLFDVNFRAKPSYYAIVQVLYKRLP